MKDKDQSRKKLLAHEGLQGNIKTSIVLSLVMHKETEVAS